MWPHQSTARPLERAASHIKVTRPPCLFHDPVNRSTTLIHRMWVTSSLIIHNRNYAISSMPCFLYTLTGMKCTPNGVTLPVRGLAKQTQPRRERSLLPVVVTSFLPDPSLCLVRCLEDYEKVTADVKSSSQLFISVIHPHNAVTSSTIARWIKEVLAESGIREIFKPHSTRGASSSAAAMAGVSEQEIKSRTGWSRKSTFCKHHYQPQLEESTSENFSSTTLSQAINMLRMCWWAGALHSTIREWLRLLGSWMLFLVVQGGQRWNQHIFPSLFPALWILNQLFITLLISDWFSELICVYG